jgi:hypothetical protein
MLAMKNVRFFAFLFPLTFLLGCTVPTTPTTYANFAGNWGAYGSDAPINVFFGALQLSNGSVTGTLLPTYRGPSNVTCAPSGQPTAVTGTLDANNNLTLTLPVAGGTATITATLANNPQTPITGSYTLVGGNCPMPATPIVISQYAPATGTYTGTLSQAINPANTISVTAVLTQSTTADGVGFPLTGTVTATGACNTSFTVTGAYSLVEGQDLQVVPNPVLDYPILTGTLNSTATTITDVAFEDVPPTSPSSPCGGYYTGTLTLQ